MKAILVLNSGSSSLKFGLFPFESGTPPICRGHVSGIGGKEPTLHVSRPRTDSSALGTAREGGHEHALQAVLAWLDEHMGEVDLVATGHRIVHGGRDFSGPVVADEAVMAALEALTPLAPLHQPHNLAALRAVRARLPAMTQVACFDTAFHGTQPALARRFALPRELHSEGVQRYGFHGLSYEYVASRLPGVLGERASGAVVIAHLGAGSSLCALRNGHNMATTMGFTALDGLMMGTRCGSLDPGVLLYLMREHAYDADALEDLLYHRSGLLGVSGLSGDMRSLLEDPSAEAREAVELYCYRAAREIGSMMAAAGGLDALVFTGGIGEHAAPVREAIVSHLSWTGAQLDPEANECDAFDIGSPESRVRLAVIPTDEEALIADHVRHLIAT